MPKFPLKKIRTKKIKKKKEKNDKKYAVKVWLTFWDSKTRSPMT